MGEEMITMLQETTDWGDAPVKNGVYHVNDHGWLVAYHPPGGELKEFKNPMKGFSKARRTFVVLDTYEEDDEDTSVTRHEFASSKGDKTYVVMVDTDGGITCNCPGFKYRGMCKHYTAVKNGEV